VGDFRLIRWAILSQLGGQFWASYVDALGIMIECFNSASGVHQHASNTQLNFYTNACILSEK